MQIECFENYELKKHTTFKIGGNAKKVWFPKNQQEFSFLLKELKDYIVLGNCSNVLISSSGYNGNIILTTNMKSFDIRGTHIIAECGVKGQMLSKKVAEQSLSGFEFMIGFPGTIGGEVFMNAGAHGQNISNGLIKCCLFDKKNKEIIYKNKDEMGFAYRTSVLQEGRCILLSAEFELTKDSKEKIEELMNRNLSFRNSVQPNLATPNAGSVFRNPPNDSAGRLLEKIGAKEFETENVKIWDKHANFIINKGNATSQDILEMMFKMYDAVKKAYTVELKPEVIFIGNKTKKEEELCNILYKKNQK